MKNIVDFATNHLPEGWAIGMYIEKDTTSTTLFNDDGEEVFHEFSKESVESNIKSMVEFARSETNMEKLNDTQTCTH